MAEPRRVVLDAAAAERLLAGGELDLVGRLVASSNNALVGTLTGPLETGDAPPSPDGSSSEGVGHDSATLADPPEPIGAKPSGTEPITVACVYKPIRGERPLWDFPDGTLALREVAAYVLSEAGGWGVVPPTVLRDGPFGPGMLQLWIEPDEAIDRVALVVEGDPRLRPMALFDAVANNADRKIGHLLPTGDGRLYGVDHGICFHVEPKLRTVLWQWQGEPLDASEAAALQALRRSLGGSLGERLAELLSADEVAAIDRRAAALLHEGRFPVPDPDRPALPWPPY
jgi:hypothetical protein